MRLKNDDVTKKAHMIETWKFPTISSNRKNIGKEWKLKIVDCTIKSKLVLKIELISVFLNSHNMSSSTP